MGGRSNLGENTSCGGNTYFASKIKRGPTSCVTDSRKRKRKKNLGLVRLTRLLGRDDTNFNSYVVGTEDETKDLHSELSLQICSCARHTVKSQKKEWDVGLQANWYYEIISWKPVHLKSPIGFKYPYLLIRPIRITGFYHAKQQQSNIWELLFWLG